MQQLQRILPRLQRSLGIPTERARSRKPEQLDLVLPRPTCSVEQAVREHLTRPDAPVYYVENALVGSLFGLLCWDAIFAPLPGAFFHPFHWAPADLNRADFHQRRADLFAACLACLDSDDYRDCIWRTFQAKLGIHNAFVTWGLLDEQLLAQALDCIPAAHLKLLFQRILADVTGNRTGLPDLIQLWPEARRYRMIEVKARRSPAGQPEALDRLRPSARFAHCRLPCPVGRGHGVSYRVAVRALCEFTAKVGDLDLRFTPSPTALEGIAGHAQVTARRGDLSARSLWRGNTGN